jgi:hypothetical protein
MPARWFVEPVWHLPLQGKLYQEPGLAGFLHFAAQRKDCCVCQFLLQWLAANAAALGVFAAIFP